MEKLTANEGLLLYVFGNTDLEATTNNLLSIGVYSGSNRIRETVEKLARHLNDAYNPESYGTSYAALCRQTKRRVCDRLSRKAPDGKDPSPVALEVMAADMLIMDFQGRDRSRTILRLNYLRNMITNSIVRRALEIRIRELQKALAAGEESYEKAQAVCFCSAVELYWILEDMDHESAHQI